jgi:hypothetical protein
MTVLWKHGSLEPLRPCGACRAWSPMIQEVQELPVYDMARLDASLPMISSVSDSQHPEGPTRPPDLDSAWTAWPRISPHEQQPQTNAEQSNLPTTAPPKTTSRTRQSGTRTVRCSCGETLSGVHYKGLESITRDTTKITIHGDCFEGYVKGRGVAYVCWA